MVIDEQKYRSIARELRKEKKLLAQLMTHCHTRYAYAPVYDAMEKGANAIEEFLDAVSNVSCSHLPSNSLLIGSDELLSCPVCKAAVCVGKGFPPIRGCGVGHRVACGFSHHPA